jgi:hypothetical protein
MEQPVDASPPTSFGAQPIAGPADRGVLLELLLALHAHPGLLGSVPERTSYW